MKVLVVGATGGSGRAAVAALSARGHEVTVLTRREAAGWAGAVRVVVGDATRQADVSSAVEGQDAVLVTLGIRENPVRVRLRGPAGTAIDVRSRGTRNVVAAMREHGVRRLVVQTSYGVGTTRDALPLRYRLMFFLLLGPQIRDTELQDRDVRESGLDWIVVQPVNLTDAVEEGEAFASTTGEVRGWHVSRSRVGRSLAAAVESGSSRLVVALS
ncbi:NAD(P)-dependent oxidoreductase [Georgenia sp. SUBG003]|uniref:NAD(P)-dependent oxidoreductase n=1 Tax=Georgenia sp. SUBG003 TaxID=1497974 RepID=UPI0004DA7E35|nr:epimerase [Georgenia sp. SUBG003]